MKTRTKPFRFLVCALSCALSLNAAAQTPAVNHNSSASLRKGDAKSAVNLMAKQRPSVKCSENSPERRGEEGCTILASRPFTGPTTKPLYWHIDRFDTLAAAQQAAGPDGVALEAHGAVWLATVEAQTKAHHGGRHVAVIGPLTLPAADRYTMRVQSSLLLPGATTPVHTHSGPEVFYVVKGEQCLALERVSHRLSAGQSLVISADTIHQGRVIKSGGRRALALVLHDAARPGSHDLTDPPPLVQCK